MKRMSMIKIAIIAMCLVSSSLIYTQSGSTELNELVLENVEALASGEGDRFMCSGSGEVDCHGYLVKIKIEGYRLE